MPTPNLYCTVHTLPPLPAPVRLSRDRSDPALLDNLRGMEGFVVKTGPFDTKMFATVQAVKHVQHHMVLPDFDAAWQAFAAKTLALVFMPDSTLRDPQGRVLLNGSVDPDAAVPMAADAVEMVAHMRKELAGKGIEIPASLTPGLGAAQAVPRDAAAVAGRALGLLTVAARADTLLDGDAMPTAELQGWFGEVQLSPEEAAFMASTEPTKKKRKKKDAVDSSAVNLFSWRYEAAAALLWGLGLWELAPLAATQVSVVDLITRVRDVGAAKVLQASLRPEEELLEAQVRARCLHWAAVEGAGGIQRGVAAERHRACNWLTGQWSPDWDSTDVPT